MCELVVNETGLLPHANAGAISHAELAALRTVAPSQGMMLESLRDDLAAHRGAPDKLPARRLATLEAAGELGIAFTTGILVGIGEIRRRPDRCTGGDRRQPSPARPRPRSHRAELHAQARHLDARSAAVPHRRPSASHRAGAAHPPRVGARSGAAESRRARRPRRAPRCRHRRLGWGVAGDDRPCESRTPVARARRTSRIDRASRARPRTSADHLSRVRPRPADAGSTRRCGSRSRTDPMPRDSGATTRAPPGRSGTRPRPTSAPEPR